MEVDEKKLYEISHTYYCSEVNYFDNNCTWEYECWDDFYEDNKNSDISLNLIFRWDWYQDDDCPKKNVLQLSTIRQRKGIFGAYLINVNKEDEPRIKEFLKPHAEYMKNLWRGVE